MEEQTADGAVQNQPEPIPYLHSYDEPKWQEAYERFLAGVTQKEIAASLKIPLRTIGWRCSRDSWSAEKKARAATNAPQVVAELAKALRRESEFAVDDDAPENDESQAVGQRRVLQRQQRLSGVLVSAYEQELLEEVTTAKLAGRRIGERIIRKHLSIAADLFALERKAWQVPDKIETKDTTPGRADVVRSMTEEQIDQRERELTEQLAAAEGRTPTAQGRAAAAGGVN